MSTPKNPEKEFPSIETPPVSTKDHVETQPDSTPRSVQEWQPIETAPKDGTNIDLWLPSGINNGNRWPSCFWGKPDHCCGEAGPYCDSDWHGAEPGWVDGIFSEFIEKAPTHWLPIPKPPSVVNGNAAGAPLLSETPPVNGSLNPVSAAPQVGQQWTRSARTVFVNGEAVFIALNFDEAEKAVIVANASLKDSKDGERFTAAQEAFDRIRAEAISYVPYPNSEGLMCEQVVSRALATLTGKLRAAWEAGIKIARGYGDNICHLHGEQKERQWRKFLKTHPAVPAVPEVAEQEKEEKKDLGKPGADRATTHVLQNTLALHSANIWDAAKEVAFYKGLPHYDFLNAAVGVLNKLVEQLLLSSQGVKKEELREITPESVREAEQAIERILENEAPVAPSESVKAQGQDVRIMLALRAADKMAWICDDWVQRHVIDARSALADARLRYGEPYKYSWSKLEAPSVGAGVSSTAEGVSSKDEIPWCQRCLKNLDQCICNPLAPPVSAPVSEKEEKILGEQ